jgi:prefoldin alpha subunit
VPLTDSLYAPGRVVLPTKALVDVGTGFFVEKSAPDAVEYCQRKLKLIVEKLGEAETELAKKRDSLETIQHVLLTRKAQQTSPSS